MTSIADIWKNTWTTKLASLVTTIGTPALILFLSIVAPFVLMPLLVFACVFLVLAVFSGIQIHQTLSKTAEDYDYRRDLYPVLKWAVIHAAVSVAAMPFAYLLLEKFLSFLFIPVLGSSALVYVVFIAIDSWIIGAAAKELDDDAVWAAPVAT